MEIHREQGEFISFILFFQNKENWLNIHNTVLYEELHLHSVNFISVRHTDLNNKGVMIFAALIIEYSLYIIFFAIIIL
jgi:hypothetical protein